MIAEAAGTRPATDGAGECETGEAEETPHRPQQFRGAGDLGLPQRLAVLQEDNGYRRDVEEDADGDRDGDAGSRRFLQETNEETRDT